MAAWFFKKNVKGKKKKKDHTNISISKLVLKNQKVRQFQNHREPGTKGKKETGGERVSPDILLRRGFRGITRFTGVHDPKRR